MQCVAVKRGLAVYGWLGRMRRDHNPNSPRNLQFPDALLWRGYVFCPGSPDCCSRDLPETCLFCSFAPRNGSMRIQNFGFAPSPPPPNKRSDCPCGFPVNYEQGTDPLGSKADCVLHVCCLAADLALVSACQTAFLLVPEAECWLFIPVPHATQVFSELTTDTFLAAFHVCSQAASLRECGLAKEGLGWKVAKGFGFFCMATHKAPPWDCFIEEMVRSDPCKGPAQIKGHRAPLPLARVRR